MADVAQALYNWSVTESSNLPADATTVGSGMADNFQQIQATVRTWLAHKGADIVATATTDLGAIPGLFHDITGSTGISSFGTVSAGIWKIIKFEGTPVLTHNATSLILPGSANITAAVGDMLMAVSEGGGNWRVVWYTTLAAAANPNILKSIIDAAGDLIVGTAADTVARLAIGTARQRLAVNSGATAPEWVADTQNTVVDAAGDLVYGTADNTIARLAIGTADQVLAVNAGATAPEWVDASTITLGTEQATTSGTSIDFTGIPAGVKRITVMLAGVSTNGTSALLVQIGDSGGMETSGYVSSVGLGASLASSTAGFRITQVNVAADAYYGSFVLSRQDESHTWVGFGNIAGSGASHIHGSAGGRSALDSALTQVRITTVNGTDAFDLGSINISYE